MNNVLINVGEFGRRIAQYISYNTKSISIDKDYLKCTSLLNPSIKDLRYYTTSIYDRFREEIKDFNTLLFIGDLSEKISIATIPLLSLFAKEDHKEIYTIITMPYRFERNRLYDAKIALDKISNNSDCIIILDKDAILTINADLSIEDSQKIIDDSIITICELITKLEFKDNILAISNKSLNDAFKDTLKILFSSCDPNDVRDVLLHVSCKETIKNVEVISSQISNIFTNANVSINFTNTNGLVLLASSNTKFAKYDPLSKIKYTMDDFIENSVRIGDIGLPYMEL